MFTSISEIANFLSLDSTPEANSISTFQKANILGIALNQAKEQLAEFANTEGALQQLETVYGIENSEIIKTRLEAWASNIFDDLPKVLVLADGAMRGAQGAYSANRNEIYLANSLVQKDDLTGLQQVILEEYGHSLDIQFNSLEDTNGDEGELFSYVVTGNTPTASVLQRLAVEDDVSTVVINGQSITVEQSKYGVDFNQDNNPDILWRNSVNGQNLIWLMGGTNNTQLIGSSRLTPVGGSWDIKGSTDFNGDNIIDLLWRNSANGKNVIWFMGGANNTESISSSPLATVGGSWDIKGIADFNNDNIDDLLWRNSATGKNLVWFMGGVNNGQSVGSAELAALNLNWDIKGVADFNNDNRPDLLWRNAASGQNTVWFMGGTNNTQVASSGAIDSLSNSWDIEGVTDFNADDRPDLFLRNVNDGQNIVWFMGGTNNTQRIGGTALSTVNSNWHPILSGWQAAATTSNFNIQFDYRFDTNGWFTSERRASLEAAAKIWEDIIQDEFADIPVNTLLSVTNPQTGAPEQFNSDYVIDDLVIFAGARDLGGSLGLGGPSGIWFVGSDLETRFESNDFEPWTGALSFNPNVSWFFDTDPLITDIIPSQQNDFVSVAVHEIGHILGIGTADAFNNLVTFSNNNYSFIGSNAITQNGGFPIPLESDEAHIQEGHNESGATGEAAMDPTLTVGTRKLITRLDAALLNDIGYLIDYDKTYNNP